jgi:hypothetical protein
MQVRQRLIKGPLSETAQVVIDAPPLHPVEASALCMKDANGEPVPVRTRTLSPDPRRRGLPALGPPEPLPRRL